MNQTQATEAINLSERNARDFLRSKAIKVLLDKDLMSAISNLESYEKTALRRETISA